MPAFVGYTYLTRSESGWIYAGKRECPEFDEKYFGSGRVVLQHIKKHGGTDLLTCEPVEFFETYEALYEGERRLIAETREKYGVWCVNILDGGEGFTSEQMRGEKNPMYGRRGDKSPNFGKAHSAEARTKMSAAKKNISPETRAKLSAANKGKTNSPEARAKMSAARKEKAHSPEWRIKLEFLKVERRKEWRRVSELYSALAEQAIELNRQRAAAAQLSMAV